MSVMQEYKQAIKELGQAYNYFNNVVEEDDVILAIKNIELQELKINKLRKELGEMNCQ